MNKINPTDFDIDFFCDALYFKLHFASAGGDINDKILMNPNNNNFRSRIKDPKNLLKFKYKLNPGLDEILSLKSENQRSKFNEFNKEAYISDFIGYAEKGLFSFDRTFISDPLNMKFHLVAYPILDERYEEFRAKYSFFKDSKIDYNSINVEIQSYVVNRFNKPIKFEGMPCYNMSNKIATFPFQYF